MALVRRSSVLGQAGQMVAAALSQPPAQAPAQAVGQAPAQAMGGAPVPQPAPSAGGDRDGTAGAVAAIAAVSGPVGAGGEAAGAPTQPASVGAILVAFGLMAAGGVGAWAQWRFGNPTAGIQVADTTTVFVALFAFATAVERLLEPFSRWLPGWRARGDLERAIEILANRYASATHADLRAVAAAKARMDRSRANRTVVVWGLATAVSTIGASAGGFYLLHAIAGPSWDGINTWVDAIVTGLVVGSGTKPLHDVISRVQKGKEKAEDPVHP
jgi:hypothetical protein